MFPPTAAPLSVLARAGIYADVDGAQVARSTAVERTVRQLLAAAGVDAFVGGNLGCPLSELARGLEALASSAAPALGGLRSSRSRGRSAGTRNTPQTSSA